MVSRIKPKSTGKLVHDCSSVGAESLGAPQGHLLREFVNLTHLTNKETPAGRWLAQTSELLKGTTQITLVLTPLPSHLLWQVKCRFAPDFPAHHVTEQLCLAQGGAQ